MGEVINLRTLRKQRDRAAERAGSTERAARHGEGKAARQRRDAEAARSEALLDGHRLEPPREPRD